MPRVKNLENRRRTFLLDGAKGVKRKPVTRDGIEIDSGFDYEEKVWGPYRTKDKDGPSDVQTVSEEELQSSQIQTSLHRGTMRILPEAKPAAKKRSAAPSA